MVLFKNKTKNHLRQYYPLLRRILSEILEDNNLDPMTNQFSVVFSSDLELSRLNSHFREINGPTDVLAFPSDEEEPDSGNKYLGDIVISTDQVKKQQELFNDNEMGIIFLLVIHGTLHLLGYDHVTKHEKKKMWDQQTYYLFRNNINVKIPE
jgi:probable rRNA maturation factor